MKRISLLLFMAVLICLAFTGCKLSDSSTEYSKGLKFELNEDKTGYILTGIREYKRNCSVEISIPSTLNDLPVVGIGDDAFINCKKLKQIDIPDSVISIGRSAFSHCERITSVVIPDSVTSISDYAFYACKGLTDVTLSNNLTCINRYTFAYCSSLTNVTIPESVTSIGDGAFSYCYSLTSIIVPDKVTHIGSYAFYHCSTITSIIIPDSITLIGEWAFLNCDSLKYNEHDNALYLGNDENPYLILVEAKNKKITSCAIKEGAKLICAAAFINCENLETVTIPNSVIYIADNVFLYCRELKNIALPNSIQHIGEYAFYYCYMLTSITIPASVTYIGEAAFFNCNHLTSIHVSENNEHYKSVNGNLYTKDGKALIQYALGKKDASFIIPDGTTYIGKYAFSGSYGLTSITIPDSVAEIGKGAFSGSWTSHGSDLEKVIFGDNSQLHTIGEGAFSKCPKLEEITIPSSVSYIGEAAFYGCTHLTSVTFKNPNGWIYNNLNLSVSDLSNTSTAAKCLVSKYIDFAWHKS